MTTFNGGEDRSYLLRAFTKQGEELQPAADAEVIRTAVPTLKERGRLNLLNVEKAGTVARLVIEGDGSEDFLQHVAVEMQWDESLGPTCWLPRACSLRRPCRRKMFARCPRRWRNCRRTGCG